jgi:hypothetical protein
MVITIIRTGIHPPVTPQEGTMVKILNLLLIVIMILEERLHLVTEDLATITATMGTMGTTGTTGTTGTIETMQTMVIT